MVLLNICDISDVFHCDTPVFQRQVQIPDDLYPKTNK